MLTKEKLLEVMTTATAKFADAMAARTDKAYEAIVTDDTCGSAGYSPFMLGGIGAGRKWVGSRVYTRLRSMGVRWDCEKYEKTVEVEATELADNPAVSGAKIGAKLAESAALTDAKEVLGVLKNNGLCFDATSLFGDHEYVDQNNDGTVKVHPVGHESAGEPVVLGTYNNDMGGSGAAWYLCNKNSVVRVTRTGEDFTVGMKGGTPESSEHTFDNDTIVWGWRARKIYRAGLPYNTIRSKQDLTATNYQAAKDRGATFINDAGELVDNRFTHIVVKRGTAPAIAAKKLFTQQFLANGESNIYATEGITVLEVDHI